MEEIDLKDLFNIFWKRKISIILITLIVMCIGVIYSFLFTTPKYSSSTSLLLVGSTKDEGETSITTTDITINSKLVSTYSEIIKSRNVLREVLDNLDVKISEDSLRKSITVQQVTSTEMIKITVTTKNATESAKIANEIAKVFITKIKEYYNMNNVQVVDEAEVSKTPSNIKHSRDIIIFGFAGAVLAVIYALIANMLDTTVKTSDDIQKLFGVPVLAQIPTYELELQQIDQKNQKKRMMGGKK